MSAGLGAILDTLTASELVALDTGGSARRVAWHEEGSCEVEAWIDYDGVWINDPQDAGYLTSLNGWHFRA